MVRIYVPGLCGVLLRVRATNNTTWHGGSVNLETQAVETAVPDQEAEVVQVAPTAALPLDEFTWAVQPSRCHIIGPLISALVHTPPVPRSDSSSSRAPWAIWARLSASSYWRPFFMLVVLLVCRSEICFGEAATTNIASLESIRAMRQTPAPLQVKVGVLLLAVGDVNLATESYEMELYLLFDCDRPCDPGNFEIMNGRILTKELQDNTPTFKVFRIRASLRRHLDLHAYPFDQYPVSISIEDKLLPEEKLVYVPDPTRTGIDSGVHIPGWNIVGHWQADSESHAYPVFRQTYSRFTFVMKIERPGLVGFFKVLLPGLFLAGIGLLALLLGPDRVMQRLTVSTSALIGAMLFHLNLTQSFPPIGYLTFADRFMIVNYVALTLSVACTVILLHLTDKNRTEEADRIHLQLRVTLPVLWILLQTANALTL